MKNLENFIHNNREAFDSSNLSENHLNKFEEKLLEKSKKKINFNYWLPIAAMIILLIGFSIVIEQNFSNKVTLKPNTSLSDISDKYGEVETFYKNDIDNKITEIDNLKCKVDINQRRMIDVELKQLDIVYSSLQKELNNNKNDQRIINAMLNNYQNKIQFLDLVINQIKNNC